MSLDKYDPIKKLIREGKKDEARALLMQAVRDDPKDARAWHGLSFTVDDKEKQKYCLRRALELSPGSDAIKARLNYLDEPSHLVRQPNRGKGYSAGLWSLLGSFLLLVLFCFVVGDVASNYGIRIPFLLTQPVTYRVEGSADYASISYYNGRGGMEQGEYDLPFEQNVGLNLGQTAVLVAQNSGIGRITCIIKIYGLVWRRSSTNSGYSIVTCSGITGLP